MKMESLQELLLEELKDLYSAETQLVKALPKVARSATNGELKKAISHHLEETKGQVDRLEQIFQKLDRTPGRKKCKGMEGLLAEGSEMLEADGDDAVRDAGIIASAQRIEHYEIAAYGCARTYAELLGLEEVAALLDQSLEEEARADKALTELAESGINADACVVGQEE